MSDEMYMDGRDVIKKTIELCDEARRTVERAFIGAVIGTVGFVAAFALVVLGMEGQSSVPFFLFAALLAIGSGVTAYWLHTPWLTALREIRKHREAMERETAKRGPGWARG